MNKYKIISKIIFAGIILVLPYYSNAQNCHAQIINSSKKPWTINFSTIDGNVHFSNINNNQCIGSKLDKNNNPVNGPCIINPSQEVFIYYTYRDYDTNGYVDITDYTGESIEFFYGSKHCPALKTNSESVTSSVGVNDPSTASISMVLESWADGCNPKYCSKE